jgi:hypothetical protein
MAPLYYHEISTTRDQNLATSISTLDNHHPTGIDIQMAIFESISGTIRDENGKSLSGIWVNVCQIYNNRVKAFIHQKMALT